jgi:hypothetical protein
MFIALQIKYLYFSFLHGAALHLSVEMRHAVFPNLMGFFVRIFMQEFVLLYSYMLLNSLAYNVLSAH